MTEFFIDNVFTDEILCRLFFSSNKVSNVLFILRNYLTSSTAETFFCRCRLLHTFIPLRQEIVLIECGKKNSEKIHKKFLPIQIASRAVKIL